MAGSIPDERNHSYIIGRNRNLPRGLKELLLAFFCLLAALFLWSVQINRQQRQMAERIAPYVLRFHVLADSNSPHDQEIKLQVKSFLLEQIYAEMDARYGSMEERCGSGWGKAQLKEYLTESADALSRMAEDFIRGLGEEVSVSASIQWTDFPEKHYGDLDFPAGTYEAFQVVLGEGRGRNWWCVLYPNICLTKDAVQVTPDSSRKKLEALLSPEDYQAVTGQRPEIHIEFAALNGLKTLLERLRLPGGGKPDETHSAKAASAEGDSAEAHPARE